MQNAVVMEHFNTQKAQIRDFADLGGCTPLQLRNCRVQPNHNAWRKLEAGFASLLALRHAKGLKVTRFSEPEQ